MIVLDYRQLKQKKNINIRDEDVAENDEDQFDG